MCCCVRSAHATDEWILYTDVCFKQPTTLQERLDAARQFVDATDARLPLVGCLHLWRPRGTAVTVPRCWVQVLDTMDNGAESAYAGWPERLYVIDGRGQVAVVGELGPDGYDPSVVAEWLRANVDDDSTDRARAGDGAAAVATASE